MDPNPDRAKNPLSTLRRLARPAAAEEQCEFCSVPLGAGHRHLLEVATRKIICSCDPCALRFENVIGRWRLIPRETRALPGFEISDAEWEGLSLPINLAFFFLSTAAHKTVAMYPSPAGATESTLPLSSWERVCEANPILREMQPEVEALLVNRIGDNRNYYLAPIDVCFELVGLIRVHWRGLSGGDKVWQEIGRFFERLNAESGGAPAPREEASHA